jgi:hypothetical protein
MKKLLLMASLGLFCPGPLQAEKAKFVRDYKTAPALFEDFIDLSKKPDEPIKYWAAQFIMVLSPNETLKPFFIELAQVIQHKNARRIACLFALHQHSFPADLQEMVLSRLMPTWQALQVRAVK